MVNFFLTRIDSGSSEGAYFSPGGYDPLLAPSWGVRWTYRAVRGLLCPANESV